MSQFGNAIESVANLIKDCKNIVAFCGSGVSEESGISTFRDPGGLWDIVDPWEVGTVPGMLKAIETKGQDLLTVLSNLLRTFLSARPNPGHQALAELEKQGKLKSVITQNIDNLHQEAGNQSVLEVHGNLFSMCCISCQHIEKVNKYEYLKKCYDIVQNAETLNVNVLMELAINCSVCGNMSRPDVVMFGEAVQYMNEAFQVAKSSDVLLILGTSGAVYPAADIPLYAKRSGSKLIEINPSENAFSHLSDIYIPLKSGQALPLILKAIAK